MQEISDGSAGDSKKEDQVSRFKMGKFFPSVKQKKRKISCNQSFNRFSMNTSLDRSHILNFTRGAQVIFEQDSK